MKKYTLALLATLLVLAGTLFSQKAHASHCAGGELTYAWLRDSTYKVTLKFYRDCTGATVGTTFPLCISSSCGPTLPPATMNQEGLPVRASSTCTPSTCELPGSSVPGYEEYVYSTNVTLPSRCNAWTFSTYLSARNTTINLSTANGSNFYVEATLNNAYAQGNTSPTFTVRPVPFVCVNKPYNYNNGANDINGDSLSFEMVYPRSGDCSSNINLTYNPPPVPGEDYDPATNPLATGYTFSLSQYGQMAFTPNTTGPFAVAMRVNEWRNKVKIGSIIRDIQIIVRPNCPNTPPYVFSPNPATSTGVSFGTPIQGCVNKPLNMCMRATNLDSNVKLKMESNNIFSAVGSILTITGGGTDTVIGCLSWTPAIQDTGYHNITYSITDTNCATNGGVPITQTYSVGLYINPVTTASPDVTICTNDSTKLRVVGGGDWIWSVLPGGDAITSLSCTQCQEPVARPSMTTRYLVTARTSNSFCNVNTDTVVVSVAPPAIFSVGPDLTTCVNNSLQLNTTVDPRLGTNFSISWTPGTFLSNPSITNPVIINPTANQTYIVKVVPGGVSACSSYDTINITTLLGFDFTNVDTQVCKGASIPVRFTGDPAYTYSWSPIVGIPDPSIGNAVITPDTSHNYVLTAKYPGCRDSVKDFYIDVQPNPVVYAGADQTICYGDTVHFDESVVLPGTYPYYTYSWSPAGSFDDPTKLHPVYTGYTTTTAILTVKTPAQCIGVDSAVYTVIPADFLVISADTAICPGDSAQLHVTGDYVSLSWKTHTYISDTLSADPYAYPITTSTYTVTGRDINYCLDTASVVVNVRPGALITLPDSVTIFPGETYTINPGGNGLYFSWFPLGGLSAGNIANPVASPSVNTRYFVTATTEAGCSVSDSIDVNVSLDSYVDIPNAFTPGSQPNALFKLVRRGNVTVNSFKVFNRWGAQMFSTNNPDEGWNGQLGGQPQPMGVYVYIVDVITPTGRHFYKQGNVTLIR